MNLKQIGISPVYLEILLHILLRNPLLLIKCHYQGVYEGMFYLNLWILSKWTSLFTCLRLTWNQHNKFSVFHISTPDI